LRIPAAIIITLCVLASFVIWPQIDLTVSGWFYESGNGFVLAENPVFLLVHWLAYYGARALGCALAVLFLIAALRRRRVWGIDAKGWLFLFLGLLLAPGLVANVGLKDHWGRARPREVTEFGGVAQFSPALEPQAIQHTNGSFVSGDAAFGFYLPAFAFVAPRPFSRRVFWGGIGAGAVFGLVRLAMGAHFLSDILYAAFLVLFMASGLHVFMFSIAASRQCWRGWLSTKNSNSSL
jgi:lipid A 4'-phosphatase